MNNLNQYIDRIREDCAALRVKRLFAFGSIIRNELNDESDIDLVVEIDDIDPISYANKYFDLKDKLEEVFKRPIDLLEDRAIRNPLLRNEINKTKVLIYGE